MMECLSGRLSVQPTVARTVNIGFFCLSILEKSFKLCKIFETLYDD